MYKGNIKLEKSKDPIYEVEFSYISKKYNIKLANATYIRELPEPRVIFNDYTEYLFERFEYDEKDILDIKLHIGKTVCDYMFSKR